MSRIDKLIAKFCPMGVPSKPLGELGTFVRGNGIQKSDFAESGVGCIHYGQIHTYYGTWATSTKSFVSPQLATRLRKASTGDLVIATTSEDDAAVAKAVAWLGTDDVAVSTDAYIFRHSIDPKYVAYFFQTAHFLAQKKPHITGTKVRRISGESLARIRIPLPPLELQRKIVTILDNYSELETKLKAELEAELEARRKQYQHYRDALLSFDSIRERERERERTRLMPLSEIGKFIRGRRFTKADYVDDGVRAIHYGEIYTHYGTSASSTASHVRPDMAATLRYAKPGDVVITDVGETVEDVGKAVAWIGNSDVAIHDHCYAFRHSMNPKFVSYCMQTASFIAQKAKYVARTKVNTLLINGFSKVRIPVPPMEEQGRIVAILDRFETSVNDLSVGLPAELKARRRQHEHYRDRLLTFKEAA